MSEQPQNKSKKRFFKKLLLAVFVILLITPVMFYYLFPFIGAAENQISRILKSYGLKVNSLEVMSVGNSVAVLKKISIGESNLLEIGEVKAEYDLRQLTKKQARNITVNGIYLNIYLKDGQLMIGGFEPLIEEPSADGGGNDFLFEAANFRKSLSGKIDILELHISALLGNLNFAGIANVSLNTPPPATLNASGKEWKLQIKPYEITIGNFGFEAALDEKERQWRGKSTLGNVVISGAPNNIPPLEIRSDFTFLEKDFSANINVVDAKKTTTASLRLDKTKLKINNANIPWGGGKISTNNVILPFTTREKPTAFIVQVDKVELSSILGTLSGGKITGQGKLSGSFPIVYYPGGRILINDGSAVSVESGIINVSPTLLAGDNQQLAMARELLQNFHYTKLKILVSSKEDNKKDKTAVNLVLEGHNPDALEGKKVNFSINITGDVLPLLQQSVLPFNDIKQLMDLKDTK